MQKFFFRMALCLCVAAGLAACEDDETPETPPAVQPTRGERGMYVVNQGNSYAPTAVDGSISYFSFEEGGTNVSDLFYAANNQSLGDTPQRAVLYGSKMYVPVFASNLLWVLDAQTLRIVAQVTTASPEAVCGAGGYVFVANNDGHVTRVDTTSYAASAPLAVGPNPADVVAVGDSVYVSVSDGYNSANGYADGFRVAVVDARQMVKTRDITVGMNPGKMATDAYGNVFVVCMGNYGLLTPNVSPEVWKIDAADGRATAFCPGSIIATNSQNRTSRDVMREDVLYVINYSTNYTTYETTYTSAAYHTTSGEELTTQLLPADQLPPAPIAMDVNPADGCLYVCTDKSGAAYAEPGSVMVYTANGTYVRTYAAGVHPYGVVFR